MKTYFIGKYDTSNKRKEVFFFFEEDGYTEYFLETYFKSRVDNSLFSFPFKLSPKHF